MTKDQIKEKIKKLLSLANDSGSYDEESYTALAMAQKLMVQYKIEEGEITEEEQEKCIHKKTTFSYGSASSDYYLNDLAEVISENFCCIHYLSKLHGSRTKYVWFMGMESDVSVAIEAMSTANMAIIRGYNRVYRKLSEVYNISYVPAKLFNPAKEGYCKGYIEGLKEVLAAQRAQNQEWGLVLVAPKEAQDFLSSLDSFYSSHIRRVDNSFYDEGYEDGKRFNMNKKVDTSDTYLLNE